MAAAAGTGAGTATGPAAVVAVVAFLPDATLTAPVASLRPGAAATGPVDAVVTGAATGAGAADFALPNRSEKNPETVEDPPELD